MTGLLADMQNKNDYCFNKYQRQIANLEEELTPGPDFSSASDVSDSDTSFNSA